MSVLNVRDFKEFPACDVLGYSLDFTTASPLDIKSASIRMFSLYNVAQQSGPDQVVEAVKRGRRILEYEPDEDTRKLDVGGVIYDVPRSIGVSSYNSSDGTYVTYKTGTEAASSLTADASLSVRYLAVSASASISYALDKSYKREDQWAMYSFNADTYLASMRNYVDLLAETRLKNRLEDMSPINGNDKNSVEEWKEFFASWGSHVIINARFGARFQLNVYASNSDSSVNSRFSTSVTAAFDGVVAGGKFDASVTKEDQYRTFMEFMQSKVSIVGGDPTLNLQLTADPAHNDRFVEWAGTVSKDSSITGLNVVELWVLMKEAARKEIRDAANMVKEAYNWIVEHPVPFKTTIVFDIQSDWAEFNLLSPEGLILPDPLHPFPDNTVSSNVRVQWGKERSHQYERKTLRSVITRTSGEAVLTFEQVLRHQRWFSYRLLHLPREQRLSTR
ncbi:hypothetical protein EIP86_006897 [Pleurotus ostreatoroseus]|nr:hypothetical protein EIP86_006897 [Pleurotus ostreatoroseus]